ncbi:MAG: NADH-quinone oxidoreductase subunit L [Acidimicrobiales bacterium]
MTLLLAAEEAEHAAAASAGWVLEHAWIIPLIPFVSFWFILFFGKKLGRSLPLKGAEIGILAVGASLVLSLAAGLQWIDHVNSSESTEAEHALAASPTAPVAEEEEEGDHGASVTAAAEEEGAAKADHAVAPVHRTWTWFESGGHEFKVGILVDGLSVMMLIVVTIVSFLVHIYSTDYVGGDRRYTHFFAFLSLFTASMLALVISANTVQFLTAWELVGVCSFALIGHWWEDKKNSDAALKAFITNRVGDVGLIVGVSILFFTAGGGRTFDILDQNVAALTGVNIAGGSVSHTALTVASLCLIAAVMSKSGQFILHTWLPDAMAGPTPVSALIHAATMVVAGVFMVARLYGVFWSGLAIPGSSINFLAWTGAITTMVGGSLAFVQRDIKRVLAYSTVSQLGYMVMALGVGAWTAATFHLFTHAFFKACLFLGSGSVSNAVHHSFDMKSDMGGLKKYMPKTHATFLVGTMALAGVPLFSGFWSKDEILAGTGGLGLSVGDAVGNYHLMLVMGLITGGMTAAYMTRCYYLTFCGEYRGHGVPHEQGPRITVPLMILAGLSFVTVFANIPGNFDFVPEGARLRFEHFVEPKGDYFPALSHAEFSPIVALLSLVAAGAAFALAYQYYFVKVLQRGPKLTELPNGLTSRNRLAAWGLDLLKNKYYLDHLYFGIVKFVKLPLAAAVNRFNKQVLDGVVDGAGKTAVVGGHYVYNYLDQKVVDGVVNGSGSGAEGSGQFLRRIQSGRIQQYAALMFAAAALLAGMFIAFV